MPHPEVPGFEAVPPAPAASAAVANVQVSPAQQALNDAANRNPAPSFAPGLAPSPR